MKRAVFALCLLLVLVGAPSASAAVGDQLLFNRGLEAGTDSANTAPAGWSPFWWATDQINRSTFTWSTDAHTGMRSARVDVNGYTGGDSKWVPNPAPVTGGTYYTFSDWYRSTRSSAVSVYYELATDTDADGDGLIDGHWSNLFSGIAPASEWTQYKTGFTMPAGAVSAQFVHFIAGNGRLETDDYSLTEEAAPPGFSKPMISLTFDDGSRGFWDNARDTLKAKGFETTQYIPTLGLTNPDPFMMTRNEIMTLAKEGNEIGGHSTTHPLLTTVTDAELDDELVASKNVLETISGVGTVSNLAYPFGDYDARVIAAGEAAGYRSGRSVEEGYNSMLDLELFDIRVQNVTRDTTVAQFKSWISYAEAHDYWLVIVYHEVVPDVAPRCANPETDPDPCVADFDTTVSDFKDELDLISSANLEPNVMTVQRALAVADAEMHGPLAGTVRITPAAPTTSETLTAMPSGFSDVDGDELTYRHQWKVNGVAIAGATGERLDLSQVGHGDAGDVITVDVSARDPKGHASTGVSDSVTIANLSPSSGPTPTPGRVVTPAPTRTLPPPPVASVDKTAPRIVMARPKPRTYTVGKTLKIKISCTDGSGRVQWRATVRRSGGKARTVKRGTKLRLSRTGRYALRVTAKDRSGNFASKTVRFRVVRR